MTNPHRGPRWDSRRYLHHLAGLTLGVLKRRLAAFPEPHCGAASIGVSKRRLAAFPEPHCGAASIGVLKRRLPVGWAPRCGLETPVGTRAISRGRSV